MKINRDAPLIQNVQKLHDTRREMISPKNRDATVGLEKVTISPDASMAQAIHKELENVPDVRMDKVNEIKQLVDTGNYERSPDQVAEKVIINSLIESLYK